MASLQLLEDRAAIADVVLRYGVAIDTRDWPALTSCFRTDARILLGTRQFEDAASLVAYIQEAVRSRRWQQHLLGMPAISVTGDSATSRCNLQALQVEEVTPGEALLTAGTYVDTLVRTGAGWLISERRLEVGWTGTVRR